MLFQGLPECLFNRTSNIDLACVCIFVSSVLRGEEAGEGWKAQCGECFKPRAKPFRGTKGSETALCLSNCVSRLRTRGRLGQSR